VRTLGIDLAAQPANTSACAIEWGPARPVVSDLRSGVLIASLVARAAALGLTQPPESAEETQRAVREGWIHVPTNPLAHLFES
jgi:hypothetical protein